MSFDIWLLIMTAYLLWLHPGNAWLRALLAGSHLEEGSRECGVCRHQLVRKVSQLQVALPPVSSETRARKHGVTVFQSRNGAPNS